MSSTNLPNADYLIDVNIACYNHEKFIAQALDSVLTQKTTFKYRIIIGDDCSSDKSVLIIKEYEKKYPEIIKAFYHPKNKGILKGQESNGLFLLNQSTSKYIAFLDGDDYWDDTSKLQKQVNLIESDLTINAVCHNIKSLTNSTNEICNRFSNENRPPDKITINDMLIKNMASTATVLVKTEIIKSAPKWIFSQKAVDYFLWCYAASRGVIGYIHEPMSVYRVHDQGIWSKMDLKQRLFLETENLVKATESFCPDEKLKKIKIKELNLSLLKNLKKENLKKEARYKSMKLILISLLKGNLIYAKKIIRLLNTEIY
jgi:glycosyltransferase involved in cell wall biosynthesis